MDLGQIIEPLSWPLIVLVAIIFAVLIFKNQIRQLLPNVSAFEIQSRKRKYRIDFGQRVQKARVKARNIEKSVTESGVRPSVQRAVDYNKQSSRDLVLQSWGALKQTIYSACAAMRIPMTPSTDTVVAMQRLLEAGAFEEDMVSLLESLRMLGEELASDKELRPIEADARSYKQLADIAMDWMMLSLITPGEQTSGEPEESGRRATAVGGNFSRPQYGEPAASLLGIGGKVEGRRYSIDRVNTRIGSDAGNDMRISEDEYVSGRHAEIQFVDGNLYIRDLNSRNGTFVNDRRVSGSVMLIQPQDRIRMGESVFQVINP